MKARTYFRIMLMLLALVGMTACDKENEDNPANPENPESKTQTTYYYYKGQKMPLTLNENNYYINIPKEYAEIRERVLANIRILEKINDETFDGYIVTRADYKRLTAQDFWKEDAKSVIVTASYFYEDNKVFFLSPYMSVKLKREEDIDLLSSYAEKYKLEIVEQNLYMPLWYILRVTPESEKSPLDCANELYESGDFGASAPDMIFTPFINTSGDIEEHEVSPEEIPEGALNQTTTEFSGPVVEKYVFKNIHFDDTPVEERPKTAAEFFNTFIGEGVADCFKCTQHIENSESEGWGSEYYQQYYKDVIVKIPESYFAYADGAVSWAVCYYLPIKDFDITPKFDKWVAYEIFKSFMKLENYYEDRCELQIVNLSEGDSVGPRLVYEVIKGYEGLVIDARSGRALYRTSYDW